MLMHFDFLKSRARKTSGTPSPARWHISIRPWFFGGHSPARTKGFLIVSHPRSGSNLLRRIVRCDQSQLFDSGEPFHINPAIAIHPSQVLGIKKLRLADTDRFLDALAASQGVDIILLTVFGILSGHKLKDSEVAKLALKQNLQVVLLIRKNLLKAFVSLKRGLLKGVWHADAVGNLIKYSHSLPIANALEQSIGRIKVHEARKWIESNRRYFAHVEETMKLHGKEYCKVYYEDLCCEGPQQMLSEANRVRCFLGLRELSEYQPPLSQTASRSFYDSIPNKQELVDALGFDLD